MTPRTISLATLAALASLIAGCSEDSERSGDRALSEGEAATSSFSQKATADLTAANGRTGLAARDRDAADGGFQPFTGVLPLAEGDATGCADIDEGKSSGSCACRAGGSLDYATSDIQALRAQRPGSNLYLAVDYKDCKSDLDALTGKLVVVQSDKPIIDHAAWLAAQVPPARSADESSSGATAGSPSQLWHAENLRTTSLEDGTAQTLSLAILRQDGEVCLRTSVDGGSYYVCRGGDSTRFVVHAKNGSFTCSTISNECAASDGGATLVLDSAARTASSDGGAD